MQTWIYITIAAAFSQNLRFMLQKQLKASRLSTGGATFARFVYSAPLVVLLITLYFWAQGYTLPHIPHQFWIYAFSGGIAQILATMCVVALFAERNFAVGITFKKTEVVQTAFLGLIVLGEGISFLGFIAISIGFLGVILLSDPPVKTEAPWAQRIFNRSAGLGLLSGVLFAVSAIGYRGASLSLEITDFVAQAGLTLAFVVTFQTLVMCIWLWMREVGEITRVFKHWRVGALVGLTSMIGSFGWFAAFTLQNAAYVKALGQIELLFSFITGIVVFREKTSPRELAAMGLVSVSIIVLILAI